MLNTDLSEATVAKQAVRQDLLGRRRLTYLTIIAANCVAAMQIGKVPGVIPLIRAEFHLTLVQVGWIFSLSSGVAATAAFMVPGAIRVTGPRRLVVIGMACLVGGSFAGALSGGAATLVASRLLESVGVLCVAVGGPALLVTVAPKRTAETLMGFWPAAMPIGTAAALFATPMITQSAGWRGLWWASGCTALLALVVLVVATRDLVPAVVANRDILALLTPLRQLGTPAIRCLCTTATCYAILFIGVLGLLPAWFVGQGHFSLASATALTGLAFITNGILTITAGMLQLRGAPAWLLMTIPGLIFVPCLMVIYTVSLPLVLAAAVVCVFSGSGGFIASVIMRAIPRHAGTPVAASQGVAMVIQFTNIGQLLGPPLVGTFAEPGRSGWLAPVLILPALVIVSTGLWLRSLDHTRLRVVSVSGQSWATTLER